jgi:hypothetical protein
MRRAFLALLTVAIVMEAGPVLAYRDVGLDPEDAGGGFLDIRRSVRATGTDDAGRRWLRVGFRSNGEYAFIWRVRVYLDSRDGPRFDYIMGLWEFDQSGGRGCAVHPRAGRPGKRVEGTFRVNESDPEKGVRCRVRLGAVHPTKRIRWRLVSIDPGPPPDVVDRAPNGGAFYG